MYTYMPYISYIYIKDIALCIERVGRRWSFLGWLDIGQGIHFEVDTKRGQRYSNPSYPTRWAPTSYKWSYNPYK